MSTASIPMHPEEIKAFCTEFNVKLPSDTKKVILQITVSSPGIDARVDRGRPYQPSITSPKPARQRPQPRRERANPHPATPYQAKRAAMEDLPLHSLRRDGFTPYFGKEKRFLMTPPEFTLVLACESRQVALVIFEVLTQSVGYPGDSADGRREWVALSFRHFERRGLLSHQDAKRALDYAVDQGYLLRRRRGQQRWEYAVHYRQANNVPR
jgi:hypothetical protein